MSDANCNYSAILQNAGIRPSSVRVHVLRYLEENRNHPTVDKIYRAMKETLPALSRTSIYNALFTLEEAGLVFPLHMDAVETHFDSDMREHGHFFCKTCGEIFDFELPEFGFEALENFTIRKRGFFVWGECPSCSKENSFAEYEKVQGHGALKR
jgi:Fe2+ or Zn2+ uptake regulation protein